MLKAKMPSGKEEQLIIEYPCSWDYKVIGEDPTLVKDAVHRACAPQTPKITYSHTSSGGKYHSFSASVVVEDEEQRLAIFEALKQASAIKMVL